MRGSLVEWRGERDLYQRKDFLQVLGNVHQGGEVSFLRPILVLFFKEPTEDTLGLDLRGSHSGPQKGCGIQQIAVE